MQRARVLLLAADGVSNSEVSAVMGVSRPTVLACQFGKDRLVGFGEVATGRGRKPSISDEKLAEAVAGNAGGNTCPVNDRRVVSDSACSTRTRASPDDRFRTPATSRAVVPNPVTAPARSVSNSATR